MNDFVHSEELISCLRVDSYFFHQSNGNANGVALKTTIFSKTSEESDGSSPAAAGGP